PIRQWEGAPAPAEVLAEARRRRPARRVAVKDAVDPLGARQKPQARGGQMGATRAASRQAPPHGGEVIEDALAEERPARTRGPLVAQHRPLAAEGEVLGLLRVVVDAAADEPDAMAAAELGHGDAAREELAEAVPAIARPRPA